MEALGRLFNIIPTFADSVYVNMRDCQAVTFVGVGNDVYTVQSSATASGGADLDVVDHWYTNTSAAGAAAWVEVSRETADAAVDADGAAVAVFTVEAASLPDGHKYLQVDSTSTGLVIAIAHDLTVQRNPANLPALGV